VSEPKALETRRRGPGQEASTLAIYDTIGAGYGRHRRPEPRWESVVHAALAGAEAVINVGAGAGSYEPTDRFVIAGEPSWVMIAQRAPDAAPVVQCVAESLPFPDRAFDVALAMMTVHHWHDAPLGLSELRRVAPRQIVFTWDPALFAHNLWFVDEYLPEVFAREAPLATLDTILQHLAPATVRVLPVPADCTDGVLGAFWRRPYAFLDADVRASISGLALLDQDLVDAAVGRLERDLESGAWHRRHASLLALQEVDLGYRLVIAGSESS
jgi:SAM-dependent methyltransferase